ncbi:MULTISPECIES: DNA polymerase III subunit [Atopobiaceae]|uniref:DNA polymerase III, delta prime subunit n=1 Tax=Parafannyhessea umbonata TaxID=604330 RepID=A0A1H6HQH6_9ACTN|nr:MULTISPECIES: DNA polymerase III subunit delta' [Atopobiaceae]SEH36435.1 DNA polymerase III, delta prime subunit [Parafannyhessea umbonata]SJZ38106.1 DNA polymerase-3 subunit delta' [Olsenella sp. KH1P3]
MSANVSAAAAPKALEALAQQPRVQRFFSAAVAEGRLSHAYLFVGAPGSGMKEAACAIAQCVVCPNGGDASCDECIRVAHRTHPDVRWLSPQSVSGYLVSQVRDLIEDVSLAPVRASSKVYVLDDVGMLRGTAANALLKTIEEPPAGVVFILIARTVASVLPTIVSRCQVIPFSIVSPDAAEKAVELACGATATEARIALSVAQTPERAAEFLKSMDRRQVRRIVVRVLGELERDDSWDVLKAAKEIVEAVRVPLGDLRDAQEKALDENSDYLAKSAMKRIEDANKRELTARERSGMMEALAAADSLLRDVLLRCEGVSTPIVNEDAADVVDRIAASSCTEATVRALDAITRASHNLTRNVSPQLTLEVMLLSVKEALACPPSSR